MLVKAFLIKFYIFNSSATLLSSGKSFSGYNDRIYIKYYMLKSLHSQLVM